MLIAAIAVVAQSCEGPTGPEGPMGPAGPAGKMVYIQKDFKVYPNDWFFEEDTYYCEIELPELTNTICETASFNVYYYLGDYQKQLPFIQYESEPGSEYKDPETGEIKTEEHYYSKLISYDFKEGLLTFIMSYSDFGEGAPKDRMDFRLVVHY